MIQRVIVDTGPIVALINARDQWHDWVRAQFDEIVPPLATCEAVLSEACFLARRTRGGDDAVLTLVDRGVIELAFDLRDQFSNVSGLMRRFANVPMSIADACLVRMAELPGDRPILTLDGDFRIYRKHRRRRIPLVIPEQM